MQQGHPAPISKEAGQALYPHDVTAKYNLTSKAAEWNIQVLLTLHIIQFVELSDYICIYV